MTTTRNYSYSQSDKPFSEAFDDDANNLLELLSTTDYREITTQAINLGLALMQM
jgi:hypothetical protein